MKTLSSVLPGYVQPHAAAISTWLAVAAAAAFLAAPVMGASTDFATDFSGSTLDSALTANAPGSTTIALDGSGHINVFTGNNAADIWDANFGGPTVRYPLDENDTRPFVLETEITNYRDSGNANCHAGLILRFADRTMMWGPQLGSLIKHEANIGDRSGIDLPDEDVRSIGGADINLKLRVVRTGTRYMLYFKRNSSVSGASAPDADWVLCNVVVHDPGAGKGPQWVGLFSKTWSVTYGDVSFNYLRFSTADVPSLTGLFYDFSDGTLQGWQLISQGGGPNLLVDGSESGRIANVPCIGTSRSGIGGGFTGDNAHAPIIVRSPIFVITNAGWITWTTVGGAANTVDPGTGTGPYPGGAMGMALVEAATGNRIMSDRLSQQGATMVKYLDVSSLANNGKAYYLEAVDNFSGGWGYGEWDSFIIPGRVIPALTYNFNDGTLQEWQVISQGGGPNALPVGSWNNLLGTEGCLSTARTTASGGFVGDNAHSQIVVRSPVFTINAGATVIRWNAVGGNASLTVDPGTGTGAYPAGALGVTLVEAATGNRILSSRLNQEGLVTAQSFDVTALANNGTPYYLEVVDNFSGSWGYGEWDDFTVPGSLLTAPQMQVLSAGQPIGVGSSLTVAGLPGTGVTRQFIITNLPTAADPLHLPGNPVVALSGDPQFTLTSGVPAGQTTLAPGAGTSFSITFQPAAYGTFTGRVSIANNQPYKNPYTFTIVGHAGPLAYYTFDNAGNPWEDGSGNGRNIIGDGGTFPTWTPAGGFAGSGSYLFNNARLIAPLDIDIDAMPRMTWGAWVRTDLLNATGKFLGSDDGCGDRTVGMDRRGDNWADVGGARFTAFTGCGGPINNPVAGFAPTNTIDWTFVAVTYDQATLTATVYVDLDAGTTAEPLSVFSKTGSAFDGTTHPSFAIGSINPAGQAEAWVGAIDQVFVFDDVLDAAAITELRNAGSAMPVARDPNQAAILSQPRNMALQFGSNGTFNVGVTGAPPYFFQWYHGTTLLTGETNAMLGITNADSANAGDYSVVITNAYSAVTSSVARLTVYSVQNSLLAHWKFDEITGLTAHDDAANHFDGLLLNFPGDDSQWQLGLVDFGAIVLATNRRVEVVSNPAMNLDSFTLAFWIQLNSEVTNLVNILARERLAGCPSWGVELNSGNILNFFVFGGTGAADVKSSVALQAGPIYHVVCRYSLTNVTPDIYVNGALASANRGSSGLNGAPAYDGGAFMFGGVRQGGCAVGSSFDGLLDDVQLYVRPLSDNEVTFLHGNPGMVLDPILLPPSIMQQPQSQEVSAADTVSFVVISEGSTPLYYQWLKDGAALGAATTNATLWLTNVQPANAGGYSVIVSNFIGSRTSEVATLTVVTNVLIAGQPQNLMVPVGGSGTFSISVKGAPPISYQWYHGTNAIAGATTSTLALSNVGAADAGSYWVVAANGYSTVTSSVASVVFSFDLLLAYEGFEYATGAGALPGKNGGYGWGDAWRAINGIGENIVGGSLNAGAGAPGGFDARSLGNHAFLPNAQRDGRPLNVAADGPFGINGYLNGDGNIGADGKTLYISFLQQPNDTTLFYEFEFHRGDLGDPGRIGGIGNDRAGSNVNLRTGGDQTPIGPGSTAVNFYIVRIDFKPGNDDVRVYMNPTSPAEPATATLARLAASDMSFSGISFGAFVNGRTVRHDEIRLGTSWASVLGLTSGALTTGPAILPNGHFQVGLVGAPSTPYTVLFSTNVSGPWLWFTNLTAGPNGLFQLEDPTAPLGPMRFYRTRNP